MSGPSVTWTVLDVGNATSIWEKVGIQVQALQFPGDAPEPHPRTSAFMLTPLFNEWRNECYMLLRDEIRQAMQTEPPA